MVLKQYFIRGCMWTCNVRSAWEEGQRVAQDARSDSVEGKQHLQSQNCDEDEDCGLGIWGYINQTNVTWAGFFGSLRPHQVVRERTALASHMQGFMRECACNTHRYTHMHTHIYMRARACVCAFALYICAFVLYTQNFMYITQHRENKNMHYGGSTDYYSWKKDG